ncbi:hypothetical protein C8A05DRAFT_30036 [Staphylotrichum tortipilum]|uniref:Uncharacterized protein n=1 Tax=Staphylotrichum tortipilum TaxID=2831512 RepID=A0AAN6MSF9_9PEZI|nr:hypothetical protein C8A05DRAFT_30036 [Staphylotrichum longicolle]
MSDEDYMAFLDKANADPAVGVASASSGAATKKPEPFKTTEEGVEVPEVLVRACQGEKGGEGVWYVSEADERFVPVALGWDEGGRGLPDEEEFAQLIRHWDPKNAEIEILDPVDWDRDGNYAEIVEAVTEAGQGNDVRVYRVVWDGARVEYWVVTTEGKGKGAKLVGAKALAIES